MTEEKKSSRERQKGRGTWSPADRRSHFNGMEIRGGGVPASLKEGDKERSGLSGGGSVDDNISTFRGKIREVKEGY